jgi:hypothetical protein
MNTENKTVETNQVTEVRTLKRQPGLGRLNRLIRATTDLLVANGHTKRHFKRNYATGTATYICPNCKSTASVKLEQGVGQTSKEGDALALTCTVVTS